MSPRLLSISLRCCTLVLLTGCSSFSPVSLLGPRVKFADAKHPAKDIICMWEPSEGRDPEGKPARGFEGTILFFDRINSAPVGVHGTLTFYVYDDLGPRESWGKPIAEYSFTPEQWDQFFTFEKLGPCYRIFIPYPRKQPYQVKTSLWVKFEPADGSPAFYSKRTPIVLPGALMEDDRIQILNTAKTRGYSPENMQEIVAAAFDDDAPSSQQDPRIHTIHRWDPAQPDSVIETSQITLPNQKVTHGEPAGANAGLSESAPGAAAESWGSTPPALSSNPERDSQTGDETASTPKRFKLTAPE